MEQDFDIAHWVKEARLHWGQSQEALGEHLGKTKGNISAWENGRHEPSFKQVLQISAITGYALPSSMGQQAVTPAAANDPVHNLDPDDLITVIRGFKHATPDERRAILQISGRALARSEGKNAAVKR